jgi:selenocysteine lyase/cysteine desulfurase
VAGRIPELERNAPARYLDQALRAFAPDEVLEAIAARGRRNLESRQLP